MSLLQEAKKASGTSPKRLKLFVFGDTGSGKTVLSLSCFPSVFCIDTEKGTEAYEDTFNFHYIRTRDIEKIEKIIDELNTTKHSFQTLVLDSLSMCWDAHITKWQQFFMARKKGKAGHKEDFYEMQISDWSLIKNDWKRIIRKVLDLDMNIVVTARSKEKMDKSLNVIGETFECEKATVYYFDTVIKLISKNNSRIMQIIKDRGQRLGTSQTIVNPTAELFAAAYPNLGAKSEPRRTREQLQAIKECLQILCLQNGDLGKLCEENLKFSITGELTQEQAGKVIEMLNKKIADRRPVTVEEIMDAETEEVNK